MSEYGALPTNGVGAGMKKDAFADAVERARQVIQVLGGRRRQPASELAAGGTAASLITRDVSCS